MELLPIKIKIAGREFPMSVGIEEEAIIRSSGNIINQGLKNFREEYKIDDKQSLLSMYAIDSTTQRTIVENTNKRILETIDHKLDAIETLLESVL